MTRLIDADAIENDWFEFHQPTEEEAAEGCMATFRVLLDRKRIDNAPTIDAVPHWVPCEERLPELDEICLVTEKDGSIRHCYFDSADPVLFATFEEGMYVRNVVAWMPLPEPYKEEQDG